MNTIGTSASTVTSRRLAGLARLASFAGLAGLASLTGFAGFERDLAEPAEQPEHRARQAEVDDAEGAIADRDDVRPGDGLVDLHHVVDDPRLAPHIGGDPADDDRDHRERPGQDHGPVEPAG